MTSTNDGKDVKSNQTNCPKGKTYYIELYKTLEARLSDNSEAGERTKHLCEAWRRVHSLCLHSAPSTHLHLLTWLQRHTARTVLQTGWQLPKRKDDRKLLEDAIDSFIAESEAAAVGRTEAPPWETQLVARGLWFKRIIDKPWDHPVLTLLLNPNDKPPTDDEVLQWLKEERGVTFVMRLHTLVGEKCEDIASALAAAVMTRARASQPPVCDDDDAAPEPCADGFAARLREEAGFTAEVWDTLTDIEFVLHHKRDSQRTIALAKQTPLREAYQLIERLHNRLESSPREKRLWKNAKEVAILIAQVVIARCMVIPSCSGAARSALYCCTRSLAARAPARLLAAGAALAAPAPTARHLHTLCAAVRAHLPETNVQQMRPFVCELYVRAITAGINELEKLKLNAHTESQAREVGTASQTLAAWLVQLGGVLAGSRRVSAECALTAFSLHPSPHMYDTLQNAAPPDTQPQPKDPNEPKEEATKSEFGSWATDSRSMTNFVKTSETLNMKQTQNQANVLSTAILNEGEAIGLSPELCQDIAVVLSGPRVKTFSWDMNREELLEKCRLYMERTQGGTRALTTELKYLNLDPAKYQHLPEDKDDDEDDLYYGIEKGYEHLVQFEEPEEIWPDLQKSEKSDDSDSSYGDMTWKKTSKRNTRSSDNESDPLISMAQTKKHSKKKEQPHSKERSRPENKDKKQKKIQEDVDPLLSEEHIQNKTKEKKERKKKEKTPKVRGDKPLAGLVGLKVGRGKKKKASEQGTAPRLDTSKGKYGDIATDKFNYPLGLHGTQDNSEISTADFEAAIDNFIRDPTQSYRQLANSSISATNKPRPLNPTRQTPSSQNRNVAPPKIRDDINLSISKLLEFRRQTQKATDLIRQPKQNAHMVQRKPTNAIVDRQDMPIQTNISPKAVAIPEIPKSYINKQLVETIVEQTQPKKVYQIDPLPLPVHRPVIQFAKKNKINSPGTDYSNPNSGNRNAQISSPKMADLVNVSIDRSNRDKLMRQSSINSYNDKFMRQNSINPNYDIVKPPRSQNVPSNSNMEGRSPSVPMAGQNDYLQFLKEYQQLRQKSVIDDALDMSTKSSHKDNKKDVKPLSRVIPVVPNLNPKKGEVKLQQCAKPPTQQKKPEVSLNTFSRLSYMHKNKQTEMKNKHPTEKPVFSLSTYQEVSSELDEIIKQHKRAQMKVIQVKNQNLINESGSTSLTDVESLRNNYSQTPANPGHHHAADYPLLTNIPQFARPTPSTTLCPNETPYNNTTLQEKSLSPPKSSLASRDHDDLVNLRRQQTKLNSTFYQTTRVYPTTSVSGGAEAIFSSEMPLSKPSLYLDKVDNSLKSQSPPIKKVINIISNSVIKSANGIQTPNIGDVKSSPIILDGKKHHKEGKIKKTDGIKNQTKTIITVDSNRKTDWESVMNAILKHKTPSRGPNALEVALNNSSFQNSFETALKKPTQLGQQHSENSFESTKNLQSKSLTSQCEIKNDKSQTVKEKSILQSKRIDLKKSCNNVSRSDTVNIQTCIKTNPSDIPKKVPHDVQTKQFTYTGIKQDDPFISGIPNSDYDLLEELMDDDLRKEIGELSSDEESFNEVAQSYLKPLKNDQKRVRVELNASEVNAKKLDTDIPGMISHLSSNEIPIISPSSRLDKKCDTLTSTEIGSPRRQGAMVVGTQDTAFIKTNATQSTSTHFSTIADYSNVTLRNTHIDSNIYVTAIPQQAPMSNVVLVQPELVSYTEYPAVPTPVNISMMTTTANAFVAVNTAPNVALYPSTLTSASITNPLLIGTALAMTIGNVPCTTVALQSTAANKVDGQDSETQTANQKVQIFEKPTEINIPNCHDNIDFNASSNMQVKIDNEKLLDQNCSKINERKVLSEVQEYLSVAENTDIVGAQIKEYDNTTEKNISDNTERLEKKRMAIINREIYHRCGDEPIALTYMPLSLVKKVTNENRIVKADSLSTPRNTIIPAPETVEHGETVDDVVNTGIRNSTHVSDSIGNLDSPATSDNNESCKENKNVQQITCRRILLRSSNKIKPKPDQDSAILFKASKKSKVKLKPEMVITDEKVANITSPSTNDYKETIVPKRSSKRILCKKLNITNHGIKTTIPKHRERKPCASPNIKLNKINKNVQSTALKENKVSTYNLTNMNNAESKRMDHDEIVSSQHTNHEVSTVDEKMDPSCPDLKSNESNHNMSEKSNDISLNENKDKIVSGPVNETDVTDDLHNHISVSSQLDEQLNSTNNSSKQDIGDKNFDCSEPVLVNSNKATDDVIEKPVLGEGGTSSPARTLIESQVDNIDLDMSVTCEVPVNLKQAFSSTIKEDDTVSLSGSKNTKIITAITENYVAAMNLAPSQTVETDSASHKQNKRAVDNLDATLDTDDDIQVIEDHVKESRVTKCAPVEGELKNQQTTMSPKRDCSSTNAKDITLHKTSTNKPTEDISDFANISQSYKDSVIIEHLPDIKSDGNSKKCVRVKLPNGRTFKATISGDTHVNFDTLFENPSIKSTLLNSLSCKKRYTMNIKQITTVAKHDPNLILSTRIQEIKSAAIPTTPVETIDLLSDDEENECQSKRFDTQTLNTEYGSYKIARMEKDLLEKHQIKLLSKAVVQIKKLGPDLSGPLPSNSKPKEGCCDKIKNNLEKKRSVSIPHKYIAGVICDIGSNLASSSNNTPDVVEIDDSSNDSVNNNKGENKRSDVKINELKDVLLQELGVDNSAFMKNNSKEIHTIEVIDSDTDDCEPTKTPTASFANNALKDIIDKICYVKLTRCDTLIKQITKLSSTLETGQLNDERSFNFKHQDDANKVTDASLKSEIHSQMLSISNLATNEVESETERCNSPVIELFDVIASLGGISKKNVEPIVAENVALLCEANWFTTKRTLRDIIDTNNKPSQINITMNSSSRKLHEMTLENSLPGLNSVPSLITLALNFLQDTDALNKQHYHSSNKFTSEVMSLKRKLATLEENIMSKVSKAENVIIYTCTNKTGHSFDSTLHLSNTDSSSSVSILEKSSSICDFEHSSRKFVATGNVANIKKCKDKSYILCDKTKCDDNHNVDKQTFEEHLIITDNAVLEATRGDKETTEPISELNHTTAYVNHVRSPSPVIQISHLLVADYISDVDNISAKGSEMKAVDKSPKEIKENEFYSNKKIHGLSFCSSADYKADNVINDIEIEKVYDSCQTSVIRSTDTVLEKHVNYAENVINDDKNILPPLKSKETHGDIDLSVESDITDIEEQNDDNIECYETEAFETEVISKSGINSVAIDIARAHSAKPDLLPTKGCEATIDLNYFYSSQSSRVIETNISEGISEKGDQNSEDVREYCGSQTTQKRELKNNLEVNTGSVADAKQLGQHNNIERDFKNVVIDIASTEATTTDFPLTKSVEATEDLNIVDASQSSSLRETDISEVNDITEKEKAFTDFGKYCETQGSQKHELKNDEVDTCSEVDINSSFGYTGSDIKDSDIVIAPAQSASTNLSYLSDLSLRKEFEATADLKDLDSSQSSTLRETNISAISGITEKEELDRKYCDIEITQKREFKNTVEVDTSSVLVDIDSSFGPTENDLMGVDIDIAPTKPARADLSPDVSLKKGFGATVDVNTLNGSPSCSLRETNISAVRGITEKEEHDKHDRKYSDTEITEKREFKNTIEVNTSSVLVGIDSSFGPTGNDLKGVNIDAPAKSARADLSPDVSLIKGFEATKDLNALDGSQSSSLRKTNIPAISDITEKEEHDKCDRKYCNTDVTQKRELKDIIEVDISSVVDINPSIRDTEIDFKDVYIDIASAKIGVLPEISLTKELEATVEMKALDSCQSSSRRETDILDVSDITENEQDHSTYVRECCKTQVVQKCEFQNNIEVDTSSVQDINPSIGHTQIDLKVVNVDIAPAPSARTDLSPVVSFTKGFDATVDLKAHDGSQSRSLRETDMSRISKITDKEENYEDVSENSEVVIEVETEVAQKCKVKNNVEGDPGSVVDINELVRQNNVEDVLKDVGIDIAPAASTKTDLALTKDVEAAVDMNALHTSGSSSLREADILEISDITEKEENSADVKEYLETQVPKKRVLKNNIEVDRCSVVDTNPSFGHTESDLKDVDIIDIALSQSARTDISLAFETAEDLNALNGSQSYNLPGIDVSLSSDVAVIEQKKYNDVVECFETEASVTELRQNDAKVFVDSVVHIHQSSEQTASDFKGAIVTQSVIDIAETKQVNVNTQLTRKSDIIVMETQTLKQFEDSNKSPELSKTDFSIENDISDYATETGKLIFDKVNKPDILLLGRDEPYGNISKQQNQTENFKTIRLDTQNYMNISVESTADDVHKESTLKTETGFNTLNVLKKDLSYQNETHEPSEVNILAENKVDDRNTEYFPAENLQQVHCEDISNEVQTLVTDSGKSNVFIKPNDNESDDCCSNFTSNDEQQKLRESNTNDWTILDHDYTTLTPENRSREFDLDDSNSFPMHYGILCSDDELTEEVIEVHDDDCDSFYYVNKIDNCESIINKVLKRKLFPFSKDIDATNNSEEQNILSVTIDSGKNLVHNIDNDSNFSSSCNMNSEQTINDNMYQQQATCYVSPLIGIASEANICINDKVQFMVSTVFERLSDDESFVEPGIELDMHYDAHLKLILPARTYTRKLNNKHKSSKRRMSMSDIQYCAKRIKYSYLRKCKNIDTPKMSAVALNNTNYVKEFKNLFSYCSSVKFSYSLPFHKEYIDVHKTLESWPIQGKVTCSVTKDRSQSCEMLYKDLDNPTVLQQPFEKTLAQEIIDENGESNFESINIDEKNFSMGFGDGSDRVIQEQRDGDYTTFSAATLSDVKQIQPLLPSEELHNISIVKDVCDVDQENYDNKEKMKRFFYNINLKEKVRSFFEKSKAELKVDCVKNRKKDDFENTDNFLNWPFSLASHRHFRPAFVNITANVVQVGQLPVSATAQNPVTCDPRVTHVSNVSPSQCSPENNSGDELQTSIKTEYTELTTADITLPLMHEYAQQHQTVSNDSQQSINIHASDDNIPMATEIKSVVKIELMEETSQEQIEENMRYENHKIQQVSETNTNNDLQYNYNSVTNNIHGGQSIVSDVHSSQEPHAFESFVKTNQSSDTEKPDQIAHAMSAAGITEAGEIVKSSNPDALVNMISQNAQAAVDTTLAQNFSKSTPITTKALQQALAQILPTSLNYSNASENQQCNMNPQVLHIVQANNSQSVINKPNGTQLLHIVQNKNSTGSAVSQPSNFTGLSLMDGKIQQNGNLLHIVNSGSQKNTNAGQLLKRVNLLTNLSSVQGSNDKMVHVLCKSADGKSIQLPPQRSMVLRLQTLDPPNLLNPPKQDDVQSSSPTNNTSSINSSNLKETASQEIKSRSLYEENYAKFVQNGDTPTKPNQEKATSLPKFNQVFGKQVYQEKQNEVENNNLPENTECPREDNTTLDQMTELGTSPILIRKPQNQQTPPTQPNLVQQIKQTIGPMNIPMHGGVIYTRQIPVNIGNGQTINLITVPSTEMVEDSSQKHQPDTKFRSQENDSPIIKIVPTNSSTTTANVASEDNSGQVGPTNETKAQPNTQPQPVLTQMRIKLPMLSKAPQMVGTRVVRPSFFQIQRNVIGGANQQVYQQLVLTAAPQLGQSIRLPTQTQKAKTPSETQSTPESQMSSSTLEQLREFDMVLEQVKERSTVQPGTSTANNNFTKLSTSADTTDSSASSTPTLKQDPPTPVLFSVGSTQSINIANYVNRKSTITSTTTSSFVRSPDSTGIAESPTSSTQIHLPQTSASSESCASSSCASEVVATPTSSSVQPKPKKKSKPKTSSSSTNPFKINSTPPKTSSQKPLEDEQTTQRILYILAEYKEQVENSPDKDKPAPRRRNNPATPTAGTSKRKKSSSGSRKRDSSPIGEDSCRTMGSEDSSCGNSLGECNECLESHSPDESPRKVVRKLTFEQETTQITQTRTTATTTTTVPQRNVIVADGQAFAVRGATGKPATTVLMPANYLLPVSMVKGGQQIAIVTNRGPKLLVGAGESGAGGTLLFQRLIGPAGLKPVLTRPGVRHIRLPTAALHNLQTFNIAAPAANVQPPDSTASPAPAPAPPDLVDTRAMSSPWPDRSSEGGDPKTDKGNSSPEGSEPWNLPSSSIADDYGYEEIVRTDNMDRTVLDAIPDRYSPDMEAQRIFDKMFDVDSKKSMYESRCSYDIDASDDDKAYPQVVQRKDGRHHRLTHVSAAALRHKYAILEHELRLQKSLSEECEDLGVDSPSASELFPEAELLFAPSPAHEQTIDQCPTPQPLTSQGISQPDLDDQIASDRLLTHDDADEHGHGRAHGHGHGHELDMSLDDVGEIVTVGEDGMTTIQLDHEEFARSHPNTTFHSEPEDGEMGPFTVAQGLKGRAVSLAARGAAGVLMAPQTTVISQAKPEPPHHALKFAHIDNVIDALPGPRRPDGPPAAPVVHSTGAGAQVIRRLRDDPDVDDSGGDSPERSHFWDTAERRRFDFDKCCKGFEEARHTRLDTVIKAARSDRRRSGSPPLRTYPARRAHASNPSPHSTHSSQSSGHSSQAAGHARCHDEGRRRASNRGVVKRGCSCCNGSTAPSKPKKARKRPDYPHS